MKKNGFTLIELLAVIVIITIILAIAIPGISGIVFSSTKGAFESNAKMVLKQVDYKKLDVTNFDPTTVNEGNIESLLGLSPSNYDDLSIKIEDNIPIITIVGTGKWDGLIACGSFKSMKVVQLVSDCSNDLIPPVITILGDNPTIVNVGETYTDAGATALDNIDGDITSNIITTGAVNPNIVGTYTITYNVTDSSGNTAIAVERTVNVEYVGYSVAEGVNKPKIITGMTPLKWNGTTWISTTENDSDWYNYTTSDKKWANAQTADGSFWVWIPRYAYQIATNYHTNADGTINVKFLKGTTNTASDDSTVATVPTYSGSSQTNFISHPAFTFGTDELTGIWVAKFEASGTTAAIESKPITTSLRSTTIGDVFTASRNIETNSRYGWGTSGTGIDTHLMKNSEWGVVAYLSKSAHGKNAEIWINNSSTYTTGCAGASVSATLYAGCQNAYYTANGQQASTTGNIYGIYDMSGGSWEYLAAYVNNGHSNLATYGSSITGAAVKYKDIYPQGETDDQAANYALTINKKGDAVYETSSNINGSLSWYGDYSYMPNTNNPWFFRGGYYEFTSNSGIFTSYGFYGNADTNVTFRPVLVVKAGL